MVKACLLLLKPVTGSRHVFSHASRTACLQVSVCLKCELMAAQLSGASCKVSYRIGYASIQYSVIMASERYKWKPEYNALESA